MDPCIRRCAPAPAHARRPASSASPVDELSTFVSARSRMFAAALRTLRNTTDAEDIVQDVWLRWQCANHELIRNAPAFLTVAATRLALNRVTGARARREMPLDLRHTEPADTQEPGASAERTQELQAALLLLVATLSPAERGAYLLREAFNYSYREIARVVGTTEANSRQLVTRARKHLAEERRHDAPSHDVGRLAAAFHDATQSGDVASLEALLAADIEGARLPSSGSSALLGVTTC